MSGNSRAGEPLYTIRARSAGDGELPHGRLKGGFP